MDTATHRPAAPKRAPEPPPPPGFEDVDLEGFLREIQALRKEIRESLGPEDLAHLRKIERWGRVATGVGLATAWMGPNPVSMAALSLGRSTRWLLMHHCGHRGYDKVPGVAARYTGKHFARGKRRLLDWPDWMLPDAWIYEHNVLHHSNTGEEADPDLVERNTEWVRELPMPVRYAILGLLTATWRTSYYAKNTTEEWLARHGEPPTEAELRRAVLRDAFLPYVALQFGALPLLFAPLGPLAVGSAFVNSVVADLLTNIHTFLVVGPNHTGDDIPRFEDRPAGKAEFYARQVVGSVNYRTGGDLNDYLHLWLNYQIEHHLFPDIPMLKYQEIQPRVRELCERYGLPYVQESVFRRYGKLADVFVGKATMPRQKRAP